MNQWKHGKYADYEHVDGKATINRSEDGKDYWLCVGKSERPFPSLTAAKAAYKESK